MRVVHCKKEKYDVYIGRPSKWGNPFSHLEKSEAKYRVGSRDGAVDRYREWIVENRDLMESLEELRGKILGCWCAPKRCHGDILIELCKEKFGE